MARRMKRRSSAARPWIGIAIKHFISKSELRSHYAQMTALLPRKTVRQPEVAAGLEGPNRSVGALEDRDGSAPGNFEVGVRDENGRTFVDAHADESWMI